MSILNKDYLEQSSNSTAIDLSNKNINKIDPDTFKGLNKVETLDLSNNDIDDINEGLFKDLSSLRCLKLSHNKLKYIDADTFKGLRKLEKLALDYNDIEEIDANGFEFFPNLILLKLNNNKLKEINKSCFEKFLSIEVIQLFDNELKNPFYIPFTLSFYNQPTKLKCDEYDENKLNSSKYLSDWSKFLHQFTKKQYQKRQRQDQNLREDENQRRENLEKEKREREEEEEAKRREDELRDEVERLKQRNEELLAATNLASFARYEIKRRLGNGSNGTVVDLVVDKNTGQFKAMKRIEDQGESSKKEYENMMKINHENLIKYWDHFPHIIDHIKYVCLIIEYCENGDLKKQISKKIIEEAKFSEREIFNWTLQATNGLKYLHSVKMVHRDIKPANMLLTSGNVIKLADLGISKVLINTKAVTFTGTPLYMSPEQEKCKHDDDASYSYETDVWSLGCVLYELIHLKFAFPSKTPKSRIPNLNESGRFSEILAKMIVIDPDNRIDSKSLYDLLKSTFPDLII